jgi:hypothetical protein
VDEREELEAEPGVNDEVEVGGVNDEVDVGGVYIENEVGGVYVEIEVGGVKELNEVLITGVPVGVEEGVT